MNRIAGEYDPVIDPTDVYYQNAVPEPEVFGPEPLPGSIAVTTLNGLTGPTLTIDGGATGYAFVPGGTTITLTVSNAATIRTSLGLGTMAVQAASAVAITGGTITGITDLAVADGGTGAGTAAAARTNLSVPQIVTAAVAPTVNDDSGDGFAIGDFWVDTATDTGYQVMDVTVGAAVWKQVTA